LVTNPDLNWRDSTLQTDPEIVACLASTLGRPLGYGEKALGGYDPNGNSKLVVITKGGDVSVEDQILEAISGEDHAWIHHLLSAQCARELARKEQISISSTKSRR
jgi:hypothetical protein